MKLLTALCAAFLLTVSAVCQGQTTPDNLPEGVVVLVEVANPHDAWQGLQETATAVMPNTVLPPLEGLIGQPMGTRDASTVDLGKSVQLVFPASSLTDLGSCALVFHVTDVKAYLDSLAPGVQEVGPEGDLTLYSGPTSQIAIGSAGQRVVMGRGAAGEKAAAEVLSLMKAGHWPEKAIAGEDDVAVAVRPAGLLKALSAQGKDPFATMKNAMQRSMQMGGGQPSGSAADMLTAEVDVVQDILQQLDTVVVTASFGADNVLLKDRTRFVPGGAIAAYLAGLPSGKLQLQRFVPADAMGAAVGKVGNLSALLEGYGEFLRKMAEAMGADEAGADAMVKLAQDAAGAMGREAAEAGVLNPDGTMCVVYAVETTDPAAMQQLLDSLPALFASFSGGVPGMPKMGMTASAEPIVYKDHKIAEWSYSFGFGSAPDMPGGEAMADMQQKMMEAMYGAEAKAYGTFFGKTWLMTYGSGALDRIKAAIDGAATPEVSKRLAAAAAGMSGEPDVVGYLSLTDAATWYLHLLSIVLSQAPLHIDLKAVRFPEAPDVGFSARMAQKDLAEAQVGIPTAAIKSLVQGVTAAYMQAAAARGGGAALGNAPAQSKRAASQSNLHQIGLAILIWHSDHDEAWPPDLAAVIASDYLPEPAKTLVDPNDQNPRPLGSTGLKTSYEYVGSMPARVSFDTIIAYTRKGVWPEGRNVLYFDGAVAFMTEAQLQGQAPGARTTLQQSYNAVVAAYGSKLTAEDKARLQKFYEVEAPAAE